MDEDIDPEVLDAGIIAAAQRVEHYEIAAYGSACEFARTLNHDDVVALLEATLQEEWTPTSSSGRSPKAVSTRWLAATRG